MKHFKTLLMLLLVCGCTSTEKGPGLDANASVTRERTSSTDKPLPASATQEGNVLYFTFTNASGLPTNFAIVLTNEVFTNSIEIGDDSGRPIFRRPSSLDLIETDPKR